MHVYYKFGLFLIFMLSASNCYTRAAPAINQSSTDNDDYYTDDADDYYDENDDNEASIQKNRLTTTTTQKPLKTLFDFINVPTRSNHVLEPSCPSACLCLEDYKYIQCSNARLTAVPHDLPSTALIIDLSENRISELHAADFANCTKLRELNLSGNQLTAVPKAAFEGLNHLQRLRLNNNHLRHIDAQAFTAAADLSTLDLSNNSIELPSVGSFLQQPNLLELSCRNCSWTQLYDDTFMNLSSLITLKLDQNDFQKQINTKAFRPLKNLIKLRLPELNQAGVQDLCNLLKSIDNISFKHFDVSCYELVLGTSYNESLIAIPDPPYKAPAFAANKTVATPNAHSSSAAQQFDTIKKMTESQAALLNLTLAASTAAPHILAAGIGAGSDSGKDGSLQKTTDEEGNKVNISRETIDILLICIIVIAVIGIIIGIVCRMDVCGIKTKCCRTRKPEPKDQVHPTEEIPLNKLA